MSPSPDADTPMAAAGDSPASVTVQVDSLAHAAPTSAAHATTNANVPKPKRLACMVCRKRKLRCDGNRPRCATCTRLGHDCAYDEVRRKSGPKRGYVKALEERLKQVETLLRTQEPPAAPKTVAKDGPSITVSPGLQTTIARPPMPDLNVLEPSVNLAASRDADWNFAGDSSPQPQQTASDTFDFNAIPMQNSFTWEMIGLGLEEPLPAQESIDEFHQIYFEKIHPYHSMIHKYRYLAALNLAPAQRPPICLRYAMWTLSCAVEEKYYALRDLFYQRARKYIELDYAKGFGEQLISVAHAQTHVLLAQYEFKMMYFPRAWMSSGSAVRLCQMMGLHRLDGNGLDVKMCIPPPKDWTEKEERRRTFWMAFTEDRYASIGTGWPMTIDEKDVMTDLPASDDAFDMSRPEQSQTLSESMTPTGARTISTMGGVVLMACLFGRNLLHLHRPDNDDRDHDLNGEFWKRHRNLDNILLNTSLCLPSHLKLPAGLSNANVVFTNMCIHTSTICLHQAAIFKADKNRLPHSVSAESKVRCITAANEIANIMRMISHVDLSTVNPFSCFCLYVAARVFVQYLKSRPDESQVADSLRFLLAAMGALKRRNPLTESFLVQLDVDLDALGTRIPRLKNAFQRSTDGVSPRKMPGTAHTPKEGGHCHGIVPDSVDTESHCFSITDNHEMPAKTPDVVEIDPSLASVPQNPIPAFTGMTDGWPKEDAMTMVDQMRQNRGTGRFLGSTLMQDIINGENMIDIALSPDTGPSSDRPTPNSSTSASDKQQSTGSGGGTHGVSGRNSFEASPASLSGQQQQTLPTIFDDMQGGCGIPAGMTPGRQCGGAAELPKCTVGQVHGSAPNDFSWEGYGCNAALTPLSDGVLRAMLQMGTMETMDLGWDNPA